MPVLAVTVTLHGLSAPHSAPRHLDVFELDIQGLSIVAGVERPIALMGSEFDIFQVQVVPVTDLSRLDSRVLTAKEGV